MDLPLETQSTRESLRNKMPVVRDWAYLDHAAISPLPSETSEAIRAWLAGIQNSGGAHWSAWYSQLDETRRQAARLINAESSDIALVSNTTHGIHCVAGGYPWKAGDNVVLPGNEFPSNRFPWMQLADLGVEIRMFDVQQGRWSVDDLGKLIDHRTRIVAVSWIGYASGFRTNLAQLLSLVHERGALLFLDAIQGLGVFPLDVKSLPIDFLAADGHKWLMGPEGAGVLFLRNEHLDRLRPIGIGWNSVRHPFDYASGKLELRPTAQRYEGGTPNMAGHLALGASLKLLNELTPKATAACVLEITDQLCELLHARGASIASDRSAEHKSGILSFTIPGVDPRKVREHCLRHHVVLSSRENRIRVSPHAYNNRQDLERLMEALDACAQG